MVAGEICLFNKFVRSLKAKPTLPFIQMLIQVVQAFISSPAMPPRRNARSRRTQLYEDVLAATNCTSVECLRCIPESDLLAVNYYLVSDLPSTGGGGDFGPGIGFGPVVDGDYIPDVPGILLEQGRYHKSINSLIVGNMAEEVSVGMRYNRFKTIKSKFTDSRDQGMGTSSDTDMPEAFPELVRKILPTASNATIASIEAHFPYPADRPEELAWDWTTAMIFECNAYNVAKAFKENTHRYIMSIPPAMHGQDVICESPISNTCHSFLPVQMSGFAKSSRHVLHR